MKGLTDLKSNMCFTEGYIKDKMYIYTNLDDSATYINTENGQNNDTI